MRRWLRNLFATPLALHRRFPRRTLDAIDAAIGESERSHRAEIRCAIESALSIGHLLRGTSCRQRAGEVFSNLQVWDTVANNGVLVYVLIAERDIEIVADRGFDGRVSAAEWQAICERLEGKLHAGHYEDGMLTAIAEIGELCMQHFPPDGADRDELPNRPVIL